MSRDIQQVVIDALMPYVHDTVLEQNPDDDTFREEDLTDNEVYWSETTRVLREILHETAFALSTEPDPLEPLAQRIARSAVNSELRRRRTDVR